MVEGGDGEGCEGGGEDLMEINDVAARGTYRVQAMLL